MDVILAGINLDWDIVSDLRKLVQEAKDILSGPACEKDKKAVLRKLDECISRRNLTPETLSAAYARISRDPRPVNELRQAAREEVDRARQSNEAIIFGLGHSSVAEHAVFNIDILGVSRLALEFIEHFRLCSYTEKSQRYITLDGDFVTPKEILGTPAENVFLDIVQRQNAAYFQFYDKLKDYFLKKYPEMAAGRAGRHTLDGWAKEDARYCLCLATEAQLGMTANARNLERILQKAHCHPLAEVREFASRLHQALGDMAPSLIKYTTPEEYHQDGLPVLKARTRHILDEFLAKEDYASKNGDGPLDADSPSGWEETAFSTQAQESGRRHVDQGDEYLEPAAPCRLIKSDPDGEDAVFAALAHESGRGSFAECLQWARHLATEQKKELFIMLVRHLEPYHSLPRAFEFVTVGFECVMSASCYAQFKRHRMGTMTVQDYDPALGITIPPSVEAVKLADRLREIAGESEEAAKKIAEHAPAAAPYILTNAHRRRVLFQANLRELNHFMRLRLDSHAQWDIRTLAGRMAEQVQKQYPLLCRMLCGKDHFQETKKSLLGS